MAVKYSERWHDIIMERKFNLIIQNQEFQETSLKTEDGSMLIATKTFL